MVTAKQTAVLLWGYLVRHFGYPDHMVSDRGRQFISGAWKAFADQMGMKHSLSTAYHPQMDGQTERVNQVVEQYLHMYCNYEQNNWAGLLDTAAFVYNNTIHNSIGVSPFFACYGWNPKAHPDIPQHLGVNDPECSEYLLDGKEHCKYLQEQIREAQHRTVEQYNRKHKDIEFKLGTININVMMTPRSGVSVDDDEVDGVGDEIGDVDDNEVDGVGDKVGGVNTSVQCVDLMLEVIPGPQWTTAFGSIYIRTANLLWAPSDVR
ncbi:hypothetical protein NDA11_007214 [Ustilago hordei]|nr:hypothetical protein NDA11_007214 [Ustilago hordei]